VLVLSRDGVWVEGREDVLSDGDSYDSRARLLNGSSAVLSSGNSDESSNGSEELHFG
jgi:hypothetical protein